MKRDEATMHAVGTYDPAFETAHHSPERQEKEFAQARKHARKVRLLKIGLPILATLIFVGGIAIVWIARSLPESVSVSAAAIDDGRVVMQDPRMSGVDGHNRPYDLVAQRAIQSLNGGRIDLERLKANVAISDDAKATIAAASGSYDAATGMLALSDGVSVETTNGVTINLVHADINLSAGTLKGTGPVLIKTASQRLQSQTVTVEDGGKLLSFGGRVKMLLEPAASAAGNQGQAVKK
ncbi:hypothetical protein [Jiella sp. M17.18]|uniref:hypothetical protein n=1 Tax=Jiella sp. M17.18 TaxID=3234247 RepID=UPI0034DF7207